MTNLNTITIASLTTANSSAEIFCAVKNDGFVQSPSEFWKGQRASGLAPLAYANSFQKAKGLSLDRCSCGGFLYGEPNLEPGATGGELVCTDCGKAANLQEKTHGLRAQKGRSTMTTDEANYRKSLFLSARDLGITEKSTHFWSTVKAFGASIEVSDEEAARILISTAEDMKKRELLAK